MGLHFFYTFSRNLSFMLTFLSGNILSGNINLTFCCYSLTADIAYVAIVGLVLVYLMGA